MIGLALRTLRYRTGGFVAAFVAMFLGAAIVMACGGLLESGVRLTLPPQQLAGSDIVVAGNQRYRVPDLGYAVNLPERVRIDVGLEKTLAALPGVKESRGYVFDSPAPPGAVDAVGLVAERGTDIDRLQERVTAELPSTAVTLVGDKRGLAANPQAALSTDMLATLAGVFGAMSILVSIYGIASMLALSVQQRHRELALLRAVGSTPGQLRKLVLGETVVLAAIATILAIIPGRWLGKLIFDGLVDAGLVAAGVVFRLGWIPIVAGIGAAILAAVGGAYLAGQSAATTRPTQALAAAGQPDRRRIGPTRIVLGLILLAGGAAMEVVTVTALKGEYASATGMPAVIVLAIGLAVLSPVLSRPLATMLGRPLSLFTGQTGRLAFRNVRAGIDRVAAVVAPVIVLTGIATGLLSMQQIETSAVEHSYADGLVPDVVVSSDKGVQADLVAQISELPGVAAASESAQSIGFVEHPRDARLRNDGVGWRLQGVTPGGIAAVAKVSVADGSLADLHGDAVAMGRRQASELGVRLGDRITLRMGDNTIEQSTVVALFTSEDQGDVLLLPADVLAAHTTAGHVTTVNVTGNGTRSTEQLISGINGLDAASGVRIADRSDLSANFARTQQTLTVATNTIVIYTAITLINALASSTIARRREFALQRLIGFTREQVLRMLVVEGVLVAAVGVVLGVVAAIAAILPFRIGRGDGADPGISPAIFVVVIAVAIGLTLLATIVPGWLLTRQRPIEAAAA